MEGAAAAHLCGREIRAVGEVEGCGGVWVRAFLGFGGGWVDGGVVGWEGDGFGVLGCFGGCEGDPFRSVLVFGLGGHFDGFRFGI